ncbi:hypothetical protein JFT91_18000 [Pseudomonas sp. TH08]|uniref:hypothetical protein n=1 Tax=unclassified Pseudomonas TaxID=196821 RepID=UPI0019144F06|nr:MULTISPECIES: hypothetical protein [unclassified Pseudomonas]MBK5512104.1 hypothetical protein [Pseudomonas sp. TH15]MBK5534463.1 hypothetical protein [Pseudomonas sp. TH08]
MKVLNNSHSTGGHHSSRPLILSQRTAALGPDTPIVFQESCLGVSSDQSRIVLRRYFEQFSPTSAHWVEYVHSIAAADLIDWIMRHGQLHIECSDHSTPKQQEVR